ncbi:hypothetical protein [Amycolatopsis sp. cmx-8-4]
MHLPVSSSCVIRSASRHCFQAIFGRDMPARATSRPKRIS